MNSIILPAATATPKIEPISFDDTSVAFSDKSNFNLKKTYFLFAAMNKQWLVKLGTFFIKLAIRLHLPIKNLIKVTVFEQFCGGEDIKECQKTIDNLEKAHIGTILDYSIEGEDSEESFDETTNEILLTLDKAKDNDAIPFCVFKVTGLASTDLLEKIQALDHDSLDDAEQQAFARVSNRVNALCQKACQLGVKIFIDRKSTRLNSSHITPSRMPSSA